MAFFVLWELTRSVIRWIYDLVHRVKKWLCAWQSRWIQGLSSGIIYFGALRIGEQFRQVIGSPDSREFLETKGSWQYCCILLLLLICLWLISTPAFAELAETQAPFSKNDETQTFIETVFRINRVFLRLSCRQLSSMQLWWSQKQADGEEFCFQMEEKPICRKKRQLVHLNRLQVAGCQQAESWGGGLGWPWISLTAHRPEQPLRQDSALPFTRLAVGVEVNDQLQSPS